MVTYEYTCQSQENSLELQHSAQSRYAKINIAHRSVSLSAKQLRILARDALAVSLALEELPQYENTGPADPTTEPEGQENQSD